MRARAGGRGRDRRGHHDVRRVRVGRRRPERALGRHRQPAPARAASPAARAAATRRRSRSGWGRSRSAPTPAARCALPAAGCGVVGLKTPFGAITTERRVPARPRPRHRRADGAHGRGLRARVVDPRAASRCPSRRSRASGSASSPAIPSLGEVEAGRRTTRAPTRCRASRSSCRCRRPTCGRCSTAAPPSRTAACTPSARPSTAPSISAKLVRAMRTTPRGLPARARRDGRLAARRRRRSPPVDVIVSPVLGLPAAAGHRDARGGVPDPVLGLRAPVQLPRLARDRHRRDAARGARHAHAARGRAGLASCGMIDRHAADRRGQVGFAASTAPRSRTRDRKDAGHPGSLRCMVEGPAVTLGRRPRSGRPHRRAGDVRRPARARRGGRLVGRVLRAAVRGGVRADLDGARGHLPLRRGAAPGARRGHAQPAARRVRRRALHRRERADRAPGAGRGPRPRRAREPRARAARALPRRCCATACSSARRSPPAGAGPA